MTPRRPGFPARLDGQARDGFATKNIAVRARPVTTGGRFDANSAVGAVAGPEVPRVLAQGQGAQFSAARERMVRRLEAQEAGNAAVLAAMRAIERHRFVDSALVTQAYEDTSLPIGWGQTLSKPSIVARMVALLLDGRQGGVARLGRVLEIGTGGGYQAAVLARVAAEVYSIERLRALHDRARTKLRPLRLATVHLLLGDGMAGYARGAPYAGIIAAAGGQAIPQAWIDQLAVGGRIVAPTVLPGTDKQALVVLEKTARAINSTVLETVHFVPLNSGID